MARITAMVGKAQSAHLAGVTKVGDGQDAHPNLRMIQSGVETPHSKPLARVRRMVQEPSVFEPYVHWVGLDQRFVRGFTLVEMLVTVGVLGILAGLLFPALAQAKERARGIRCVGNLGQIGKALAMYEGQEHAYPGAGSPVGEVKKKLARTDDSWDGKLLPLLANVTNVLDCPSVRRRRTWGPSIKVDDYGYNANGVCRFWDFTHKLGLGYGSHLIDGKFIPETVDEVIRSGDVKAPGDMIAIGDMQAPSGLWINIITPNVLAEQYGGLNSVLAGRHRGGANVLFCDGHVEGGKLEWWNAATDSARMRWNNDHEAHGEIWR